MDDTMASIIGNLTKSRTPGRWAFWDVYDILLSLVRWEDPPSLSGWDHEFYK